MGSEMCIRDRVRTPNFHQGSWAAEAKGLRLSKAGSDRPILKLLAQAPNLCLNGLVQSLGIAGTAGSTTTRAPGAAPTPTATWLVLEMEHFGQGSKQLDDTSQL